MPQSPNNITLRAHPLTAAAFQPFGKVLEHSGTTRRHMIETDFSGNDENLRQAIWVSRLAHPCTLPLAINQLERHPHSHQAFVPLCEKPFLVVCCPDMTDGEPNLAGARAFVAGPHQGVMYRRNVWHAGLQALEAPAEFVVVMATSGACDDILFDLEAPLYVATEAPTPEDRP